MHMHAPPPSPRHSIGLALQRRALLPLIAAGLGSRPSFAAEPEQAPSAVLDLQGYLPAYDLDRLDRILTKLEADTGFKVRVLTQSRETAPEMGPVLQRWRLGDGGRLRDPNAVLVVADRGLRGKLESAGGSFIRYEVGDNVRVRVPDSYWGRLQRSVGNVVSWWRHSWPPRARQTAREQRPAAALRAREKSASTSDATERL